MTSRTLPALFLLALVGVLVAVGLLVADVGGLPLLVAYAAVVTGLLVLGTVRARRLLPRAQPKQACACCDGDHSAPVQVV